MIRRLFVVIACCCSIVAAQGARATGERGNIDLLTERQLRDYLSFIASDELEGRDTPSRGQDIAAKFIATHLSRWGYVPAGDNGSYFQRIRLIRRRILPTSTEMSVNGARLAFGTDFLSLPADTSLSDAPLVFVGHGYVIKEKGIDPYKGLDVRGKILIVLGGYPKGVGPRDLSGKLGVGYDTPAHVARRNGAAGLITIPTARQLARWEKERESLVEKGALTVEQFGDSEKQPVVSITASQNLTELLFEGEKTGTVSMWDPASADSVEPFLLSAAKKMSMTMSASVDTEWTQNIIAILPGRDKKLRNEYLAFGAHYDHIGIGTPVNGDSIYNGADDDGSGTVAMLALAETFAGGTPPRRSLLFVWHTGEEKGLWGSKYFTFHPTVPLTSIVTQINIDMIGRSRPDTGDGAGNVNMSGNNEVFVIGSKMMSSDLEQWTERTNSTAMKMQLNYRFDDPDDRLKLFYRSDHYNYAKQGIPIVFYFDGLHEDYHGQDDEVEKIDFTKYLNVTKTIYALGWKLANLPVRPAADRGFSKEKFE